MEIEIITEGGIDILKIAGRVDISTSTQLDAALNPYYTKESANVMLDCNDMDYISSSGLRVFLQAHKSITSNGGSFSVCKLVPQVKSIFDMTGFSKILNII